MTLRDTRGERASLIAHAILEYIESNPHASDTLDGIGRWWLANDETVSREDLSHALDKLVAEGHLDAHATKDGLCRWRKRLAV